MSFAESPPIGDRGLTESIYFMSYLYTSWGGLIHRRIKDINIIVLFSANQF